MRRLAWILAGAVALAPSTALARVDLSSSGGFLFDIAEAADFSAGSLSNGTTDAYDTCYRLRVGGTEYAPTGASTMSLSGRQVELPAHAIAGLNVRRLVYVPASGGDYARYLEVLENPGGSDISTTVEVFGNLGSDGSTVVTGTSSGDSVVTAADQWFSTDDSTDSGGDPSLAHVFSGTSPPVSPSAVSLSTDNLSYSWSVTVPAGGRVVIMHFAVQSEDRASSMVEARRLVEVPDDALMGADPYLDDLVSFGVRVEGAPRVRFTGPFEAPEGDAVTVEVMVEDPEGDSFDWSWDLDDDGSFGEAPGADSYTIPAGTSDGPGVIRVGVEATDSEGNTNQRYRSVRFDNVAPRISSSPPLVANVGVDIAYPIEVEDPGGDLDPPTYALVTGPARMAVTDTGVVQWTPNESDVTIAGEAHVVEVSVDDGDEGVATQRWELTVSPNRRPTAPIPAFPVDAVAILDQTPRLAAQNSEDLDLDPLTYTFQLDTTDTFDSEDLREWTVDEMAGFTSITVDEDLPLDRRYHWRVKANDGFVDSEWRATTFWVVYDPALGPRDAGVPDGGDTPLDAGADAGAAMTTDGGGCAIGGRGSPAAWLLLAGLAWLARRRESR